MHPKFIPTCLCVLLIGFIWAEIKEMWDGGFNEYVHDWWNLMDFAMNSLYLATISLKIVAYVKVSPSLNCFTLGSVIFAHTRMHASTCAQTHSRLHDHLQLC